jgi:hypothetical protein
MNVHSLVAAALLSTSAGAAEPVIFHTSRFPDTTTVELSLISRQFSTAVGYDFDVTIGLLEIRNDGRPGFRDRGAHMALVRCGAPGTVFVGGADYQIGDASRLPESDDWKLDLWLAVCAAPTS